LADLQRTVYPYKWLPISCRFGADQWKFAGQRPKFYHWATQPTLWWSVIAQLNSMHLSWVCLFFLYSFLICVVLLSFSAMCVIIAIILEAGHSMECITLASHSFAFCIFDTWPLTFWSNIHCWASNPDGLSLCQVWWLYFQRFWFYHVDKQTDRQTDRRTNRITDAANRGMSNGKR